MRDFENRDVVRILGVNPKTLIDWVEIGLVVPGVRDAAGAGTRRRYSEEDLLEIAIVQALLGDGIKRDIVKAIAGSFAQMPATADSAYLVIDLHARKTHWEILRRAEFVASANGRKVLSGYDMRQAAEIQTRLVGMSRVYLLNVTALMADLRTRMTP